MGNNTVLNQYRRKAFQLVNSGTALNTTVSTLTTQVLSRLDGLTTKFTAHSELSAQLSRITALKLVLTSVQTYFTTSLADLPKNLSIATSHLQDQIAYGLLPIGKIPSESDIDPYFGSFIGGGISSLSIVSDCLDHIDAILLETLTPDHVVSIVANMDTINATINALNTITQNEKTLIVQAVADLTAMAKTAGFLNSFNNNPWGAFVINKVGTQDFLNALNGKSS